MLLNKYSTEFLVYFQDWQKAISGMSPCLYGQNALHFFIIYLVELRAYTLTINKPLCPDIVNPEDVIPKVS